MKKNVFAAIMFCVASFTALHAAETRYENYKWEDKPKQETLTADEKKEPSVILLDKRIIELNYSDKGELNRYYIRHKKIKINEIKAVEDFNKIYIPISSEENTLQLHARTITAGGKVIEVNPDNIKEVENKENGSLYKLIAVEGLEAGSEMEYYYVMKTNISFFFTEYFQSSILTKKSSMELICPKNLKFDAKSYNGFPQPKDTVIDETRIMTSSLDKIPSLSEEQYSFYSANLMRTEYKLAYNYARDNARIFSWTDAGKRYYEMINTVTKDDTKAIKKLISTIAVKGLNEKESVRKIENHLKVNIAQLPVFSMDDEDISAIIKNKYASKLGILRIYTTMFNELNIQHEIVVSCDRTETPFDASFDTWNYLDDFIIYLPGINQYLAPCDDDCRLGIIPYEYINNDALYIKPILLGEKKTGLSTIKKIPYAAMESNFDRMDAEISFHLQMKDVKMYLKRSMDGYSALSLRPIYYKLAEDKRKELASNILKMSGEDAQLSKLKVSNFDINSLQEIEKPFIIEGDLTIGSVIEKADDKYIFKVGELIGEQVQMYQEKERQTGIEVNYPHNLDRKFKIKIPEGYAVKGLETIKKKIVYGAAEKPDMGFVSDYKINGNELEIDITEFYNKLSMPATVFPDFRNVINAAADFNKVVLVLEKKS